MKLTKNVHIAKQQFSIEEDAYETLHAYLQSVSSQYPGGEGEELLYDVELRVVELLSDKGIAPHQVVTMKEVQEIVEQLGPIQNDENDLGPESNNETEKQESPKQQKKLLRDTRNGKILGVCSGLARYFDVDVTAVRLTAIALLFAPVSLGLFSLILGMGSFLSSVSVITFIAYFALGILLDDAKSEFSRVDASGKDATVTNVANEMQKRREKTRQTSFQSSVNSGIDITMKAVKIFWKLTLVGLLISVAFASGLALFSFISSLVVSSGQIQSHTGVMPEMMDRTIVAATFAIALLWCFAFAVLGVDLLRKKTKHMKMIAYGFIGLIVISMAFAPVAILSGVNFAERIKDASHVVVEKRIKPTANSLTLNVGPHQNIKIESVSGTEITVKSDAIELLKEEDRVKIENTSADTQEISFGYYKKDCALCNRTNSITLGVPESVTDLKLVSSKENNTNLGYVELSGSVIGSKKIVMEGEFRVYSYMDDRMDTLNAQVNLDETLLVNNWSEYQYQVLNSYKWESFTYRGTLNQVIPIGYNECGIECFVSDKRVALMVPEIVKTLDISISGMKSDICLVRSSGIDPEIIEYNEMGDPVFEGSPVVSEPFDVDITVNGVLYTPQDQAALFCATK